jgi:hypothetical protein
VTRVALLAAAAVLGVASALAGAGVLSGTGTDPCAEPTPTVLPPGVSP